MNGTATIISNGNITNQQINGGNIVLVATEQMEISSSEHDAINNNNIITNGNGATDEELTPLHWLHDKNLLKGRTKYIGIKALNKIDKLNKKNCIALEKCVSFYNVAGINLSCNKAQSRPDTPNRQSSNGPLSPTSDFVEDSSVSEDNNSSVNSNSDQVILLCAVHEYLKVIQLKKIY